jgi:hypothetical protein
MLAINCHVGDFLVELTCRDTLILANHNRPINIPSRTSTYFKPRPNVLDRHSTDVNRHERRLEVATMATTKPLTALIARTRPSSSSTSSALATSVRRPMLSRRPARPVSSAYFSTSAPRSATPAGPPPQGFRLPPPPRWDESKESALDQAGKYFLLMEMARGMYVVLEQFFRPP